MHVLIATGDNRHGDRAVAHRVLELLSNPGPNVFMHDVRELSPVLAEEIATAEDVIFIDAAEELGDPWMEPAAPRTMPGRIVEQARSRFRFRGQAYVCHVPGLDFENRAGISSYAESRARQAVRLIKRVIAA